MPALRRLALLLLVTLGIPAAGLAAPLDLASRLGASALAQRSRVATSRPAAARPGEIQSLSAPVMLYPNTPGWYGWGYSVAAVGDVNGDGYADFAVSTGTASPWGTYAAAIYYGSANGPVSPPGWILNTFTAAVHVAPAGDVNGDGYDDVVFGAADTTGTGTGSVTVWYGSATGLGSSPNVTLSGDSGFGWSVCTAGDVNGDGYDDLIVGDPGAGAMVGSAWLYYGSGAGLSSTPAWSTSGTYAFERVGISAAGLGDVNGDGFADFGIGSMAEQIGSASSPGEVFYGSHLGPLDGLMISGTGSLFLNPAGDVNADGYADFFETDPYYSYGGDADLGVDVIELGGGAGAAYATVGGPGSYLGIVSFTAGDVNGDGVADALVMSFSLGTLELDLIFGRRGGVAQPVQAIYLPSVSDLGEFSACAAGDVNGDGFGDILVGLPASSDFGAHAGEILLYYGHADPPLLSAERFGGQGSGVAGWSVAIGDANGDGFDDVLVGEPLFDSNGLTDNGRVELYLGGEAGLASTPVWSGVGQLGDAGAGVSVAMGQDINGDGLGDIVVGVNHDDQVYVWYGRADWSTASSVPDQIVQGPTIGEQFGSSVAFAGDVNGDGFADVVVGSPNTTTLTPPGFTPHPGAGRSSLCYGSRSGLGAPSWFFAETQDNAHEGVCVASAGDVNGDGYSDVITGAGSWDSTATDQGRAHVFLGGPGGLATTPQAELVGSGASWFFGNAVAGIGDFDGDGYGDVAIGAYGANGTGKVFLYKGGPSGVSAGPGFSATGPSANGAFAAAVAPAGDVNGDGYSDLVVGEVFGDGPGGPDCGHVYVYLGGPGASSTPYATFEGTGNYDNLGASVAGGGDLNGDGFPDVVSGEPRRLSSIVDEGGFQLFQGNWRKPYGGGTGTGRGRPTRAMQPGPPVVAVGLYGRSRSPSMFGIASEAASPAGRERVALDWRVAAQGGGGAQQGRTPWQPMGAPGDPLEGAALVSKTVTGLAAGTPYAWKARVLSHSPWFRYGAWFTPQSNGRAQWDLRTAPGTTEVSAAAATSAILELSAAWPNPARGDVRFELALPSATAAQVVVRDVEGRTIRTLAHGDMTAGRHTLLWNGADDAGVACSPGLYFVEATAGGEHAARRVVRVR